MKGVGGDIYFLSSVRHLRATSVSFCAAVPLKKYLLFEGLEFEKVLIEEVTGGRRAVACQANNAAL